MLLLVSVSGEDSWIPLGGKDCALRVVWDSAGDGDDLSRLIFDGGGRGDQALLEIRRDGVRLTVRPGAAGGEERRQDVPVGRGERHEAQFTVLGGKLVLGLDGLRKVSTAIQLGPELRWRWEEGKTCRLAEKPRAQSLARIVLADDFMRESVVDGLWQNSGGCWAVQASSTPARAANAFRFLGRAAAPSISLSKLSFWFWQDYRFGVSVQSEDPRADLGLVVYYRDEGNYHLLRWAAGTRIELVRTRRGREEVLSTSPAERNAGTWYRLDVVVVDDMIAGYVDGHRVLLARDDALLGGRVGLYAVSDLGCWFDDVAVESVTQAPAVALERPLGRAECDYADLSQKEFTEDNKMASWARPRGQWENEPDGLFWYHCRFYNDVRFEWKAVAEPPPSGEVALFARRDRPESGYRLRWDTKGATLAREGKPLKTCPTPAAGVSSLTFTANRGQVAFRWNDDATTAEVHDESPLTRGEVCARLLPVAEKHRIRTRPGWMPPDWRDQARVTSSRHVEYLFDAAPAAWFAQTGTWRSTNRWACAAMWSFFGGRGRDIATLWGKRRIAGDFDLEFALAPMEGSSQRVHYTWPMNLCVAFGADGVNLDSGYNLIFGVTDIPSVLYRGDRVLAENRSFVIPGFRFQEMDQYHAITQTWQRIRIRRTGQFFEVCAARFGNDGQELGMTQLLEFTDPRPLEGEHFGVWTWGANGMALARASLSFERSPGVTPIPGPAEATPVPPGHVRVVNPGSGGAVFGRIHAGPIDPVRQGLLRFRYRLDPGLRLGLFVRRRTELAQFVFCGPKSYRTGTIPLGDLAARLDGNWNEMAIDLRQALVAACPDDSARPIDEVFIASPLANLREIAGMGVNRAGASYEIADVQLAPATSELPPRPIPPPRIHVNGRTPLDDFESGLGEWETFGATDGALLWRDPAGAKSGCFGLRLFNPKVGGTAGAQITRTRFDARLFPRIRLDYLFPTVHEANLIVRSGDRWFEVDATGTDATWPIIGRLPDIQADGQWHTTEFDLASALGRSLGARGPLPVDALYLADSQRMGNTQDLIYRIDNFCLVPAVAKDRPTEFRLSFPAEPVTACSYILDARPDSEPAPQPASPGETVQVRVPEGATWLHVRAQNRIGDWSPTTHLPLVVSAIPEAPSEPPRREPASPQGPPPAPTIAYVPSDRLCFSDFEWKDRDGLDGKIGGAAIRRGAWVLPCLDDGATGTGCLEIVNLFWDDFFSAFLHEGGYDLRRYPRILFDYKFETPGCLVNLTGLLNKEMYVIEWLSTCQPSGYFTPYVIGRLDAGIQDGRWHKANIDLLKMVERSGRGGDPCLPLIAEQFNTWAMAPGSPMYWNPLGARLKIDNFTIYSPRGRDATFQWKVAGHAGRKLSYAFCLDNSGETIPPETHLIEETTTRLQGLKPGMWYFHVRARGPDGPWGQTSHFGFEITE